MRKIIFFSFLETSVPLLVLIEAARAGNEKEVEDYALVFTEHANKLVEVSALIRSLFVNCYCRNSNENKTYHFSKGGQPGVQHVRK